MNNKKAFIISFITLLIAFVINIRWGAVSIDFIDVVYCFFKPQKTDDGLFQIVIHYRLPKAFSAIVVGAGLGLSGLLMQTMFRNPLAGPFVLGVSSGASLGVALLIMGGHFFSGLALQSIGLLSYSSAAILGAFTVMILVLWSFKNNQNTFSVLITGLMFGSFSNAILILLSFYSSAQEIQQYVLWSMGNIGKITYQQLLLMLAIAGVVFLAVFLRFKDLNLLLLGEVYAQSLGLHTKTLYRFIILATCILTGIITAFVGPIAFIGLAIPHLTKLLYRTSNHKILIPAVVVNGAMLMLICDTLSQLPGINTIIPLNAVTSLLGAPIVIWLVNKKSKSYE